VKGHGACDKEEVQESGDTGEKIEHPWGQVNQLVYSPQNRSLKTLGDLTGLGALRSSAGRKACELQALVQLTGISQVLAAVVALF
jgi:hypothetical protein